MNLHLALPTQILSCQLGAQHSEKVVPIHSKGADICLATESCPLKWQWVGRSSASYALSVWYVSANNHVDTFLGQFVLRTAPYVFSSKKQFFFEKLEKRNLYVLPYPKEDWGEGGG